MPKSENQKKKLLLLKAFFERETDENHPASMADILEYLAGNLCRCSGFVSQTSAILKFLKYKKAQEEA